MPASNFDICYVQDTRLNFVAMRPAPVCTDTEQGHNNIHISTNCYYGYHNMKTLQPATGGDDCEMMEVTTSAGADDSQYQKNVRKRSADDVEVQPTKRLRHDYHNELKTVEPETTETRHSEEDTLAAILWNTHGGHLYHLIQCS